MKPTTKIQILDLAGFVGPLLDYLGIISLIFFCIVLMAVFA